MVLAAAVTLQIAGFHALRRRQAPALSKWAGVMLLLGALWLFVTALGWELGLSWALVTISAVAYGLLLWPLAVTAHIGRDKNQRDKQAFQSTLTGRNKPPVTLAERLISAGPLYLLASLALGLALGTKLPWREVDRLMTGALLIPLFWSIGALHATADVNRWRILAAPIAIALASAGVYFLL